jgi:hypothetical protein
VFPDGREMINKPIMRGLMFILHRRTHWGPQAMCDTILRNYRCVDVYTIAKQMWRECVTWQRINIKGGKEADKRGKTNWVKTR